MFNYILHFLSERTFQVKVGNTLSQKREQVNGTPQGAVISPTLFNIMINEIGKIEDKFKGIGLGSFADDTAIWQKAGRGTNSKGSKKEKIKQHIKAPTEAVINTLKEKGFKVNVDKTQWIVFNGGSKNKCIKLDGVEIKEKNDIKYLGITIDKKLNYSKHIQNLVRKGKAGLAVLGALGKRDWGLNRKTRLTVYKNFVRTKMSYGQEVFDRGNKTDLKKLDVIQNKALRMCTGVPRAARSLDVMALTGIEPLDIRRKEAKLRLMNRIQYNDNNPANEIYKKDPRILYANKQPKETTGEDSIKLMTELGIYDKHRIRLPDELPTWDMSELDIDTKLNKTIKKKEDSVPYMQLMTIEHLDSFYQEHQKYYTDGSKENKKVGLGVYNEKHNYKKTARITDETAILTAELMGIKTALKKAISEKDELTAIVSDSLSSAQAIQSTKMKIARPDLVNDIKELNQKLTDIGGKATLVWIPSHVGIKGNDEADRLANEGKNKTEIDEDIKLGLTEIKSLITNTIKNKITQTRWAKNKKSRLYKIKPKFDSKINYEDSKLNSLRLGVPLFAISRNTPCFQCQKTASMYHVMMKCKYFRKTREEMENNFSREGKKMNMKNMLDFEASQTTAHLRNKLIKEINELFVI